MLVGGHFSLTTLQEMFASPQTGSLLCIKIHAHMIDNSNSENSGI